jgi:hypothetical protein
MSKVPDAFQKELLKLLIVFEGCLWLFFLRLPRRKPSAIPSFRPGGSSRFLFPQASRKIALASVLIKEQRL